MNLDQLKYLADLAKTNSMNETAKRMFITQPAVSDAIKRLEHELGCTILLRSKTGIAFTEDGEVVLECAQNMLENYNRLDQYLQSKYHREQLHGKLLLGVGPAVSDTLLPNLLLKMHQQYPSITLQVIEASALDILEFVRTSKIDFGLFGFSKEHFDKENVPLETYYFEKLYADDIVAVMAKTHPLAALETLFLTQLTACKHTTYGYDYSHIVTDNALHISNNAKIHQQFMLEENTVCSMPYRTYLANYASKQFVMKKVEDIEPSHFYLFCKKEILAENKRIYQTFIDTARAVATEL